VIDQLFSGEMQIFLLRKSNQIGTSRNLVLQ